mmetsp:Transcript_10229/g.30359  ORF Transcript_10229/g.30359 Transcript_10229/m.30359 type:complete len:406 (+) Transcript_10229:567-1784(+)
MPTARRGAEPRRGNRHIHVRQGAGVYRAKLVARDATTTTRPQAIRHDILRSVRSKCGEGPDDEAPNAQQRTQQRAEGCRAQVVPDHVVIRPAQNASRFVLLFAVDVRGEIPHLRHPDKHVLGHVLVHVEEPHGDEQKVIRELPGRLADERRRKRPYKLHPQTAHRDRPEQHRKQQGNHRLHEASWLVEYAFASGLYAIHSGVQKTASHRADRHPQEHREHQETDACEVPRLGILQPLLELGWEEVHGPGRGATDERVLDEDHDDPGESAERMQIQISSDTCHQNLGWDDHAHSVRDVQHVDLFHCAKRLLQVVLIFNGYPSKKTKVDRATHLLGDCPPGDAHWGRGSRANISGHRFVRAPMGADFHAGDVREAMDGAGLGNAVLVVRDAVIGLRSRRSGPLSGAR